MSYERAPYQPPSCQPDPALPAALCDETVRLEPGFAVADVLELTLLDLIASGVVSTDAVLETLERAFESLEPAVRPQAGHVAVVMNSLASASSL